MKHPICAIGGAAQLVVAGAASPARAEMCKQYDSTVVGKYVIQNNRWNNDLPGPPVQCIEAIGQADSGPGFAVTKQTGSAPTNGKPASYPSIYIGCHYGNCSPGTNLPIQVKSIKQAPTSITFKYVAGATYDAAYDIWLDPALIKTGVNHQEIMIWLNKQGSINPVCCAVGNADIAGNSWQVWSGSNGANEVVSYVAPSAIPTMAFNALDFIADLVKRGKITDAYYLTSIQAGFEPWQGGPGLKVEGFQARVDAP
jgi:Glycosyl hydrolase family 12